jgi:hypothetical protein
MARATDPKYIHVQKKKVMAGVGREVLPQHLKWRKPPSQR